MRITAVLLFCLLHSGTLQAQVVINEYMSLNNVTIVDEDGDFEPWLELYNQTDDPYQLQWYGLSDNPQDPWKWTFPQVTVPPGEFLLIWLSGKDRKDAESQLHAGFSPDNSGGSILLTSLQGVLVDTARAPHMPSDHSWGRFPDGTGEFHIFTDPTPGGPNSPGHYSGIMKPPGFSIQPGFYNSPLLLELHHDDPEATLFYTTDGSKPDTASTRYEGPLGLDHRSADPDVFSVIRTTPPEGDDREYGWFPPKAPVDKGHIIRAIAVKPGFLASPAATGTWFPGLEQQHLTVLSIVAPGPSLFDSEYGIYVPGALYDSLGFGDDIWGRPHANYFQRGEEWEREASFEWFEGGLQVFQQDIGIRIHGGGSRVLPQKSLRLYARSDYGQTHFRHQVFPEEPYSEFKRLILRNSGQDFFRRGTMFRDAFMHRLVSGLHVETQAYRPSVLFLNGEYWGIHNIRERYDKHYLERRFDVPEENLDLLEEQFVVQEGSNQHYKDMLAYIEEHDMADPGHLEHVSGMMDLQNFTDYNILQLFFRNSDWPGNNVDFWRYSGPPSAHIPEHDGRWRWLVFDLDFGFGLQEGYSAPEFDMLQFVLDPQEETYANPPWASFLLRSLLENDDFRDAFLRRFSDLLNTTFTPEHMKPLIGEMTDVIRPEIPRHISRWSHPSTFRHWEEHVDVKRHFAEKRPGHQISHLRSYFGLQEPELVSLVLPEQGHGLIHLNSLELGQPLQAPESAGLRTFDDGTKTWEGRYFPEIPLQLRAEASTGYRFAYWVVNGDTLTEPAIEWLSEGKTTIHPHFAPDGDPGGVIPEPIVLTDSAAYRFDNWAPDNPPGSYPPGMAFVYMDRVEPTLDATPAGFTTGAYDVQERTRIEGLGGDGFAFINTSNLEGNPGYPGRRLGGVILALNTLDMENVTVSWEAGTVVPNSREYALRLQYRIGNRGAFRDVTDPDGSALEYVRSDTAGHRQQLGPVTLPDDTDNKPHVELLWRYYHTGLRFDPDNGGRSMLNISSISIEASRDTGEDDPINPVKPEKFHLGQNYPNPFNSQTRIPFQLDERSHVTITLYDITGRQVALLEDNEYPAGWHTVAFDGSNLASGVYMYRLTASGSTQTRSMTLVR